MVYLGVDGGGTKTAFMLISAQGEILSTVVKGTCHFMQVGLAGMRQVLTEGLTAVLAGAGLDRTAVAYSFWGLPGYGDEFEDVSTLEQMIGEIVQSDRYRCGNDVEAGWAGSLACRPGINLVGGTGSIGYGQDPTGNSARAGGWGYFCGDEGSAYWLGKQLLSEFGKQADGRSPKTLLYRIVREILGITSDFQLIDIIHHQLKMERESIAQLALLLFEVALAGDQRALAIYKAAAYEYALLVKALISKLQFEAEEEVLVSYSGGVFKAGEIILQPLRAFLSREKQPVKLTPPLLKPVTGAALYALFLREGKIKDGVLEQLQKGESQ